VHVLSVSSLKGGVGKTTVTLGLASAAFAKGVSTLVVDLDPQSDVSTGMDIAVAGHLNVADVLASPKEKIVRSAIAPSGWTKGRPGTVDVLIGSPSAINFDGPHPSIRDIWKLEEALAHVEKDYELVLIDCAPSLNALTRTAWAASDRVAVVTEPGLFSVAAADRALRAIEEIRRGLSPRLQPLGIIVNRARVQSLEHQFRIKELRDMFGPLVLSPQLPERTSLQQAQGAAKPLHIWPGESAQEMARNFDQLLDRVMRTARLAEDPEAATTGPVYEIPNLFATADPQAQPAQPAQPPQPAQQPVGFPPPQQPFAQPPVQQPPVQQPPYTQPPVQQPPSAYPPTQQPPVGIPGFDFPAPQPTP
jgi:chromosome partitioning protein